MNKYFFIYRGLGRFKNLMQQL